jgi:hypothetical protein
LRFSPSPEEVARGAEGGGLERGEGKEREGIIEKCFRIEKGNSDFAPAILSIT